MTCLRLKTYYCSRAQDDYAPADLIRLELPCGGGELARQKAGNSDFLFKTPEPVDLKINAAE